MERELSSRLKLEEDIRRGVEAGEFVPFFQPLIDLASKELVGFEALARWRSPNRRPARARNIPRSGGDGRA